MENRVISSRNIDPKVHAVHRHRDVEKFLAAKLKPGIHSLWYRGLPIDMQLTIKESDTLIVVLHGAAITKVHLPWLSGTGITVGMKASRLFVSDPSLYLCVLSTFYRPKEHGKTCHFSSVTRQKSTAG